MYQIVLCVAGAAKPFMLLLLLASAAALTSGSPPEDALDVCRRMLTSSPGATSDAPSLPDVSFSTGNGGEDFLFFQKKSPGDFMLQSALRLASLSPVSETSTNTTICVGLVDTTSYTYIGSRQDAVAWITLHTRSEEAAGLVHVDTACWRENKHLAGCSPTYIPLSFITHLPQYHYSILEEKLWENFTINGLGISDSWIWKINTQTKTKQEIIEPHWLFKMNIPSLEKFIIYGNNWKSPEKLLYPMPKLTYLDISYNNLREVPHNMLRNMPLLETIILGHNDIATYPKEVGNLSLKLLDLTNPIGSTVLKIEDEDVKNLPQSLQILGLENTKLLSNVTRMLLLPQLTFLNLSGCSLGVVPDFSLNDTEKYTSSKLIVMDLSLNNLQKVPVSVFSKLNELKNLILHHNDLTTWPEELDMKEKLTDLDLSNNILEIVTADTFFKLHALQTLDLSWNHIEEISENSFKNTINLEKVDLSHNKISQIHANLFTNLLKLKEIRISDNFLKLFPPLFQLKLDILDLSFNNLSEFENFNCSIEYLDVSHNSVSKLEIDYVQKMNMSYSAISTISSPMWRNIKSLKEVDLGGIKFECCLFGNNTFMKDNTETSVKNLGSYDPLTCSVNKTSPKILLRSFDYNETDCSPIEQQNLGLGLETFLPIGMLFVAICLVVALLYVYRFELTYLSHLFQMKKVGRISDEERYNTCVYDAFVCYSAKNFPWVVGRLLPALEREPFAYRLCVHDRDFALGAAIHSNIVASLEKSRKVILVLSSDFIASKWCQWELEMANHKMFEEERNSIVLVELEPLDRRLLPRHLRYLMARTTYLQWPVEGDLWGQLPGEVNIAFDGGEGATDDADWKGDEVYTKEQRINARDWRQQRMLRREEACLKRLREALGESLRQRRGSKKKHVPHTVLDA